MITKEVKLQVDGLNLAGRLYVPGNALPYPTVCICHGISSGAPDPGDGGYPVLAETICRAGFTTFIFNFRGAGASEGNFEILGWTRDLKAAIDYLWTRPEVAKARLSLLGFSAGAAVAIFVAARDERVSSLVSGACLAEFSFIGNDPQPLIKHFRNIGIIRDPDFPPSAEAWLDSFKAVSPLQCIAALAPRPLLLVHGSRDDVVKIDSAHQLYAAAGEPKQLMLIEGAGHRLRRDERAVTAVLEWLKSVNHHQ